MRMGTLQPFLRFEEHLSRTIIVQCLHTIIWKETIKIYENVLKLELGSIWEDVSQVPLPNPPLKKLNCRTTSAITSPFQFWKSDQDRRYLEWLQENMSIRKFHPWKILLQGILIPGKFIPYVNLSPIDWHCVFGQCLHNCTTPYLFQFTAVTSPVIAFINEAYHWHPLMKHTIG
jgi:hypothetical protein